MKLVRLINNTQWEKIRLAIYELGQPFPSWRVRDVNSGYISEWDNEWFHHFRQGGYQYIEWVEISAHSEAQIKAIGEALYRTHVPAEKIGAVFRVYGYVSVGQSVNYLGLN